MANGSEPPTTVTWKIKRYSQIKSFDEESQYKFLPDYNNETISSSSCDQQLDWCQVYSPIPPVYSQGTQNKKWKKFPSPKISVYMISNDMTFKALVTFRELLNRANASIVSSSKDQDPLTFRDLRSLLSGSIRLYPFVEGRDGCIFLSLLHIRCILLAQCAILISPSENIYAVSTDKPHLANSELFSSPGDEMTLHSKHTWLHTFMYNNTDNLKTSPGKQKKQSTAPCLTFDRYHNFNLILQRLATCTKDGNDDDFQECAFLEAILQTVSESLWLDLKELERESSFCLSDSFKQLYTVTGMRKSMDLRRRVVVLKNFVDAFEKCLSTLLSDDESINQLEFSRDNLKESNEIDQNRFARDIEGMFECYIQDLLAVAMRLTEIQSCLSDALEVGNIHLSALRNTFLKADLSLNILNLVIAFLSGISSIFGMNFDFGPYTGQAYFWILTDGIMFLTVAAAIILFVMFNRRKI